MVDPSDLSPCPACGAAPQSSLACLSCGHLLSEPAGADHFLRLGLDRDLLFDKAQAEAAYLKLSRLLHPDCKAGASEDELLLAVAHSATLNEAWRVLTDDQLRAEYLLELHHPGSLEQHKTLSPAFLMEAIELSEELEGAKDDGCADTIRRITSEANKAVAERMTGVAEACGSTINRILHQDARSAEREADRKLHPHEWHTERIATLLHQARMFRRILRDAKTRT